jgi:hypothetical protein
MIKYKLVNPSIQGTFDSAVYASNPLQAGKLMWNNLSEYFDNNIPSFHFSIQEGGAGSKFHHFTVKERLNEKTNAVDFNIEINKLTSKVNNSLNQFIKQQSKLQQTGGRNKRENSSCSDYDSDDAYIDTIVNKLHLENYGFSSQPIVTFSYHPYIYKIDYLKIPYLITIPTFSTALLNTPPYVLITV